ncbi:translesion DNA synthesis-associated protein ImuA [Thalassolituus sp.]|jgi:hypothetical protein|uniref:translesion DNA synthesis-associated protein ImuA n=1 Tax=Thalassolituus sp. TaxID=2030822 RepID=UPI0035135A06
MSLQNVISERPELRPLMRKGQVWSAQQHHPEKTQALSTGYPELDRQLPGGGWQPGQICEIYHPQAGSGELSIIAPALARLSEQPRWILWVAPPAIPYAPALEQAGINSQRVLMVHPRTYQEAAWSIEEGLKSGHCSAILGWLSEWDKQHIRRLQIACQEKNAHCWLWPQREADTSGSPAPVRMQVRRNSSSTLEVNLLKCRGTWPGTPFTVSLPQRPATPHC